MPSRSVALGILMFWLATLGWMFQRELLPRFQAGDPPLFYLDLEDEVGGRVILWEVYQGEERIGSAQTKVTPKPNRTFELRNEINFQKMEIGTTQFKKVSGTYLVNPKGELLALSAAIKLEFQKLPLQVEVRGEVKDGIFSPKLSFNGLVVENNFLVELKTVDVSRQKNVLNILHPQNKIPGLFEGRTWTIPVLNPLAASSSLISKELDMASLVAVVAKDELTWGEEKISCWRIDAAEPGKSQTMSRVWVRQSDDVVLQLEANFEGNKLVLKRSLHK